MNVSDNSEDVQTIKKYVLVTGCHGGIGYAICQKFMREDWYVIGVDLDIKPNNHINSFIKCNLEESEEIEILFVELDKITDRIDCLINNAATQICKSMFDMEPDEFKNILNCNLVAPFHLAKLSLPLLKLTRGSIVNIGSVHGTATSDQILAYATSKAAIVGMTKNMAIEYSKYCIRVNCVSPGAVNTQMLRNGLVREITKNTDEPYVEDMIFRLARKHLTGRIGSPSDIAELVFFLGDNTRSEFITGANYLIDGGASIMLGTEF
jgi:NAD(P)-dependent dehydrogenase (short-subunit alcohol dehydrogenase family)